jgi:hypothetical protein
MSAAFARPPVPEIQLKVAIRRAAQEQYGRHVANRLCLAILADRRTPIGEAQLTSTHSTRGRDQTVGRKAGDDFFYTRVEPVQLLYGERIILTSPLSLKVWVKPEAEGSRLTLAMLRTWPTPKTPEVLYRYRRDLQSLERKPGLSGDLVHLFAELLKPHQAEMLRAMNL